MGFPMCPRSAEQVEQLKGERRGALLRAARVVFAKKGLSAAKISEIAAAAGYSYGLVYHYFPQKEALFAAVVEETIKGWGDFISAARQKPAAPWDRLLYVCTQMIVGVREEPEHLLLILRALTEDDAPPPVRDALARHNQQIREQLATLIEDGQREGSVAPGPPMELARTLLVIVQGLAISRILDRDADFPSIKLVLRFLNP
jgi:AcrR family transcriptional regulator